MPRVKLALPAKTIFTTQIPVRVTDINYYGGHLGNDSLLSILHEARVQFLKKFGFTESNIDGVGIIMSDAVLVYKAEVFYGDVLTIEIGVDDLEAIGADITYRVLVGEKEAARAKTGIVFFDYGNRKIVQTPPAFKDLFGPPVESVKK
ncbi:MAG: thioesterase family protein [Ignavibacteriales bacterium]|nr:thioesterase family protein [Ignavibacteriales bacterium]